MAIAAAHEHQSADRRLVHERPSLLHRGVISMVEADARQDAAPMGGLEHCVERRNRVTRGLLDEDMFAGLDRAASDFSKFIVRRRDDDEIDVWTIDRGSPVGGGVRASDRPGESLRPLALNVRTGDKSSTGKHASPFVGDHSASDDGDAGHDSGHSSEAAP